MFVDIVELKYKELFSIIYSFLVSKHYRFYDEILSWQPQMPGHPLYKLKLTTGKYHKIRLTMLNYLHISPFFNQSSQPVRENVT